MAIPASPTSTPPVPPLPPVHARTGQLCVQPSVADALTGLALLVLPPLALLAYMGAEETSRLVLLGFLMIYAATCVIAVRGFLSDSSPWRVPAAHIPARAHVAALLFGFALAWGASFVALPDSASTAAAIEARVEKFESATAKAIESASEAGKPAPSATPVPVATTWEDFLATDAQAPIGWGLVALALAGLGVLGADYARARWAQLRAFPAVGPFDIPEPPAAPRTLPTLRT